jgi:hypothetical protein
MTGVFMAVFRARRHERSACPTEDIGGRDGHPYESMRVNLALVLRAGICLRGALRRLSPS